MEPEEAKPVTMTLGDTVLVYEKKQWHVQSEGNTVQTRELQDRNEALEKENQLLRHKLKLVTDYAAVAKLDSMLKTLRIVPKILILLWHAARADSWLVTLFGQTKLTSMYSIVPAYEPADIDPEQTAEDAIEIDDILEEHEESSSLTDTESISPEQEAELLGIPMPAPAEDGVFSNLSARPVIKEFEELEPPTYEEANLDPTPSYFDTSITGIDEDGEILIEGLPVGDVMTFLANTFISVTFDVIGFLLTTFLAGTHAARAGSKAGLGLTMIRFGGVIHTKMLRGTTSHDANYSSVEEQSKESWSAIVLTVFGVFLFLRATVEYWRVQRMKNAIEASSSIITNV